MKYQSKRASQFRGMTPKQIKKAIWGERTDKVYLPMLSSNKKKDRPDKSYREIQHTDNGLLLNLPFSTTQSASLYKVPEWFKYTQVPDVSVIIPIYNTNASNLIQSWNAGNDGLKVELVFVDDNCPANSKDMVIKELEDKKDQFKTGIGRIYTNSFTQGWCACCNIGAEFAAAEIVVFIHPNAIVDSSWLKPLVRQLRKEDVGVVGPLLLTSDEKTFWSAGGDWSWANERFLEIGRETYRGHKLNTPFQMGNCPDDIREPSERESINGYCMAIKKRLFRYVGGFSPNLVSVDWAEADLCCVLKQNNLKVICQPNSIVSMPMLKERERKWDQGKAYFRNKWVVSERLDSIVAEKRAEPPQQIDSILIRRRAAHGDVLLASAIAPALKKKYPQAKIVFCTDCPEVLQDNPWIDKIVEQYSERWFQLYCDLDMVYEYRPDVGILQSFAESVGVDVKDCDLFLKTEPIDLPDNYVVIHAGKTLWAGRNWSTLKFDQISSRLRSKGYKVVCVGTWSDHKTSVCDIDLRDKTSIPQLATAIMNAKLFVGIDSFPMHVAQVFEVPGVCFFGSINPETRLINSAIRPVYAEGLKCLGCHHRKATPCTSTTICEVGIQDCINSISADHMWRQIELLV